jgi:hypothetical protein
MYKRDVKSFKPNMIRRLRSKTGAAIAEGAAMLPLIILICVVMVLFLLWAGFNMYYRVKLAYVAGNVANYAAGQLKGDGSDEDKKVIDGLGDVVDNLASAVGLPTVSADAKVDTEATPNMVLVKLSMNDLQFFNGTMPTMTIIETGSSILGDGGKKGPDGYAIVGMVGMSAQVNRAIPCYAFGAQNDSSGVGSWKPPAKLNNYGVIPVNNTGWESGPTGN